jgi:hypothetical protein
MAKTARSATVMDKFVVPSSYSSGGAFISQRWHFVSHRFSRERSEAVRRGLLPQEEDNPDARFC